MTEPSATGTQTLLIRVLAAQRQHVLGIVEGLDDDALRRAVLPSGWTCLGLVQHLALDVERFWFGAVMGGDPSTITALADTADAWQVDPASSPASVLDLYRRTIADADEVIAATPLDAAPRWWPEDQFGTWRAHDLGEVMLHVIAETACHSGHLDAAREIIDGRQWFVIDE